jgi:hypothetical protein
MLTSTSHACLAQVSVQLPSTYTTLAARNAAFVKLLPIIRRHARIRLRHLRYNDREEAVQEIVASAFAAFVRLVARRQGHRAFGTPLGDYAVKAFRAGRRVGARLNRRDITSRYCTLQTGVTVTSLIRWDDRDQEWREVLIEDRRFPPAEAAAARLDFAAWLAKLPRRNRRIATVLATGESTFVVARRFRLTSGRISQLRRVLCDDWHAFIGDGPADAASAARRLPHRRRTSPQACHCR